MTTTQTNIFEYATRNKLRFAYCGNNSVEELWDLKLEDLDNIYKALNKQAKSLEEDSLLTKENSANEALTIKIEIIKYIVSVKISEQKAKTEEAAKKAEARVAVAAEATTSPERKS